MLCWQKTYEGTCNQENLQAFLSVVVCSNLNPFFFFLGDAWKMFQAYAHVTIEKEIKHSLFCGKLESNEIF